VNVLHTTALEIAQRFIGETEVEGQADNPLILAMLQNVADWPEHDEVPWCSAFVYFVADLLGLPVPEKNGLMSRSWLTVGSAVPLEKAEAGLDVVVLSRGANPPGPEVLDAPGHVGFLACVQGSKVLLCGGNQGNAVSIAYYPQSRILGVRRLTNGP
jgi:uncharacterized protein (TIGR02594 family)